MGTFNYTPTDHEAEKASNGYLMSLIAVMAGLPLPILNLLATFIFYLHQRKGTAFVQWHARQALFSQVALICINSPGFYWTMSILFGKTEISNAYIAYMLLIILINLSEFIATIYTMIQVRQGRHVSWWLFGDLAALKPTSDHAHTV
ncbi:MAG: DUF4870 domain-containing protein [Saprospiraceae bacterium]|nr:DUF4870 domain-containing protein [Saprospiraceae bacterium]